MPRNSFWKRKHKFSSKIFPKDLLSALFFTSLLLFLEKSEVCPLVTYGRFSSFRYFIFYFRVRDAFLCPFVLKLKKKLLEMASSFQKFLGNYLSSSWKGPETSKLFPESGNISNTRSMFWIQQKPFPGLYRIKANCS